LADELNACVVILLLEWYFTTNIVELALHTRMKFNRSRRPPIMDSWIFSDSSTIGYFNFECAMCKVSCDIQWLLMIWKVDVKACEIFLSMFNRYQRITVWYQGHCDLPLTSTAIDKAVCMVNVASELRYPRNA
jgi:hypothetical protein